MLIPEFWLDSLMNIVLNIITTYEITLHPQINRNGYAATLQPWVIPGGEKFSINISKHMSLYEEQGS
jgi:hypothetical protein